MASGVQREGTVSQGLQVGVKCMSRTEVQAGGRPRQEKMRVVAGQEREMEQR